MIGLDPVIHVDPLLTLAVGSSPGVRSRGVRGNPEITGAVKTNQTNSIAPVPPGHKPARDCPTGCPLLSINDHENFYPAVLACSGRSTIGPDGRDADVVT